MANVHDPDYSGALRPGTTTSQDIFVCLMCRSSKSIHVTDIKPSIKVRIKPSLTANTGQATPTIHCTVMASWTHPLIAKKSRKAIEKNTLDIDFFALNTIATIV